VSHTHQDAAYWARPHTQPVVLDIGDGVGALVLYTGPELHQQEIEVTPLGVNSHAARVHSAVLERSVNGRTVYAAVYPELRPGAYHVCCAGTPGFSIAAGSVTELDISHSA
jgi:hypothetical protein